MMIPSRWPVASVYRVITLYVVLVLYGAAYEYFYATQLTKLFHDDYTAFDFSQLGTYRAICFLTPLAILPIGTRLRAPGQFIAGALAIFIFIPIPIVFVAMVPAPEFWRVYALLWLSYFAVCSLSSVAIRMSLPVVSEPRFRSSVVMLYLLIALGFAYALATNHFAIASLGKAHEAREDVTVFGLSGYMLVGFITSFGGLLIAMAIMYRKYYLIVLALMGFTCCYGMLAERTAVLMPAWIIYVCLAQRFFFRDSAIRHMLTVMAPFLFFLLLSTFLGLEDRRSTFYDVFTLANYRLYSIPAISFNTYYNFFATHPLTYWSHIGFISNFVHYPYGESLGLVMSKAYLLGDVNASFLETDGLAAGGPVVLPFISLIFGLVLLAINSSLRGLNLTLCATVMAGASVALIDTGLGPGLLTNGLALLTLFLAFAPRNASWNLRYLERFQRRPASYGV